MPIRQYANTFTSAGITVNRKNEVSHRASCPERTVRNRDGAAGRVREGRLEVDSVSAGAICQPESARLFFQIIII